MYSTGEGESAYSLLKKGRRLLEAGEPWQAATVLERARALEPRKGSVRETLGRAYYRSGRFEKAREEFRAALEIDPANDYAHFCLALCLARLDRREEARGHIKMALVMRPDNPAYRRLGQRLGLGEEWPL
jgi:tetratricopeptide (TPR) repeat protein